MRRRGSRRWPWAIPGRWPPGRPSSTPTIRDLEGRLIEIAKSAKIKNVVASGYLTPNGIVVLAGSEAVLEERKSAKKWPSVMTQRNKLIEEGGLIQEGEKYIFVKDTEFSSPSSAAVVIHGGSANGLTAWVNRDGTTLKELQSI